METSTEEKVVRQPVGTLDMTFVAKHAKYPDVSEYSDLGRDDYSDVHSPIPNNSKEETVQTSKLSLASMPDVDVEYLRDSGCCGVDGNS